jgi:hypothetical protein
LAKGVVKIRDLTSRTEQEVAKDQVLVTVRDFFRRNNDAASRSLGRLRARLATCRGKRATYLEMR